MAATKPKFHQNYCKLCMVEENKPGCTHRHEIEVAQLVRKRLEGEVDVEASMEITSLHLGDLTPIEILNSKTRKLIPLEVAIRYLHSSLRAQDSRPEKEYLIFITQTYQNTMDKNFQEERCTGMIKFTPPLYKQRYQFVKDLVGKYKPKKVADLGCADCTLLWMLKFYNCIEVLAGLDICASVMKEKMHRLYPLPADYLQPSERSLTVTLHHGSVAHEDPCMLGFDLVTCIELIEHLEESELEKFPEVVFGFMAPTMVVISTPNSEFNPLLPGVTVFRHQDHKFEWNRAQFQSWALDAAKRYGYSVEFTGVGNPPTGMEDVGFCTQIAVFVKKYPQTSEPAQSKKPTEAAYKTVFRAVYPSLKDEKYLQSAVVSEVMFTAHAIKRSLLDHLVSEQEDYNDDPTERKLQLQRSVNCFSEDLETLAVEKSMEPLTNGSVVYIPLRKIFSFPKVNQLCGTFEKLCELITGKVTLSSDGSAVVLDTDHENEEN